LVLGSGALPGRVTQIAVAIRARPTCLRCVAAFARLTLDETLASLEKISGALTLIRARGRCVGCGETKTTFSV
jgi:hypothetical protein